MKSAYYMCDPDFSACYRTILKRKGQQQRELDTVSNHLWTISGLYACLLTILWDVYWNVVFCSNVIIIFFIPYFLDVIP